MKSPRKAKDQNVGASLRDLGKKWLDRVEDSGKREKVWLDDAKKAVRAYTNEADTDSSDAAISGTAGGYDFNILYANVETIVPAVINSSPVPDIRRRFQDDDDAARIVSDILERAIRVQIDDSRLQSELEDTAQDAFLAGRGVIRLRFFSDIVPVLPGNDELEDAAEGESDDAGDSETSEDMGSTDDGNQSADAMGQMGGGDGAALPGLGQAAIGHNGGPPLERLENERIRFEAVSWSDYRHGPAKRWSERPWEAFRFCIPREDEDKSFDAYLIGQQLSDVELNERKGAEGDLIGWEIWDKDSKKVLFIDDKGTVLMRVDDPLGLSEFFCTPSPIQPISINGRLMPVNPFSIYRTLANDLDTAVRRKIKLIHAMKVKGWYGVGEKDLQAVLDLDDNEFAPIADPEVWAQNGGIQNAIAFWPFEKFISAIQQLDRAIDQYKQWIYEITGISDIVRGASVASETATAQNIKSQWGSLRIQKMQRLMERCARDLFVMMAEIIPSKFTLQTLEEITGIKIIVLPEDAPEVVQQKLSVQALLKRKLATFYRIDVESDSTVRADLTRQKQEVAEFLQGASSYFGAVAPLVQQGALPAEAAVEIFAATARMFNLGKSVEDTLEQMVTRAKDMAKEAEQAKQPQGQPGQPQEPTPEQQAAEAAQQAAQAEQAAKVQAMQIEGQAKQQDLQQKGEQFQFDMQRQQAELEAKMAEASRKAEADGAKAQQSAILSTMEQELKQIELAIKRIDLEIKQTELAKTSVEAMTPAIDIVPAE